MKERLQQLLELEKITPSKFADLIGVQRSSISHVISGRNKPSFDFLEKTLKAFPGLKADWLILGKGSMYEQMGRVDDLFGSELDAVDDEKQAEQLPLEGRPNHEPESIGEIDSDQPESSLERRTGKSGVIQVVVFYDDQTFTSYRPRE